MTSVTDQHVPIARQFLVFAGVGIIGTCVHYALLILLVQGFGAQVVVASTCGFAAGAVTNYVLNYRITFRSRGRHLHLFPRFLLAALTGLPINAAIMQAAAVTVGLPYLLAQMIATGVTLIWNFVLNRFWTFRQQQA